MEILRVETPMPRLIASPRIMQTALGASPVQAEIEAWNTGPTSVFVSAGRDCPKAAVGTSGLMRILDVLFGFLLPFLHFRFDVLVGHAGIQFFERLAQAVATGHFVFKLVKRNIEVF